MLSFVKALFSRISLAQQVEDLTRDVRALEYELEMIHLEYEEVIKCAQFDALELIDDVEKSAQERIEAEEEVWLAEVHGSEDPTSWTS